MARKITIADLLELSPAERLLLVHDLWDSVAESPEAAGLTPEQSEDLNRRIKARALEPTADACYENPRSRLQESLPAPKREAVLDGGQRPPTLASRSPRTARLRVCFRLALLSLAIGVAWGAYQWGYEGFADETALSPISWISVKLANVLRPPDKITGCAATASYDMTNMRLYLSIREGLGAVWSSMIVMFVGWVLFFRKSARLDGITYCGNCDYALRGITEPRCPECGTRL